MDKQNYQRSTEILIKNENPEGKILVNNLKKYKETILEMDVFPLLIVHIIERLTTCLNLIQLRKMEKILNKNGISINLKRFL